MSAAMGSLQVVFRLQALSAFLKRTLYIKSTAQNRRTFSCLHQAYSAYRKAVSVPCALSMKRFIILAETAYRSTRAVSLSLYRRTSVQRDLQTDVPAVMAISTISA